MLQILISFKLDLLLMKMKCKYENFKCKNKMQEGKLYRINMNALNTNKRIIANITKIHVYTFTRLEFIQSLRSIEFS